MARSESTGWSRRRLLGTGAGLGVGTALGTFSPAWSAPEAPAASTGPLHAAELRTELARDPLGIDRARPRLSWWLQGGGRGARQTAYRILVAGSAAKLRPGEADVWDSGRVESADTHGIAYGGPPVTSRKRYFWTVRTWDEDGRPSQWSRPARWEAGLTGADDWVGDWIGGSPEKTPELGLDDAHWIWYPEGDPAAGLPAMTRWFRLGVDVPQGRRVERARMFLTADDSFVLWADGHKLAETGADDTWQTGRLVDLTESLGAGAHVLAIAVTNKAESGGSPSPAGLIGRLVVEFESGEPLVVDSDESWRTWDEEQPDWQRPDFDHSGWKSARKVVPYGKGPWGKGVSDAQIPIAAPLLRREFDVRGGVRRARLYVACAGYHELQLNGERVGDQVLAPATTDYDERLFHITYDVTGHLRRGRNAVGAELGRGFYAERTVTAWDWTEASWRGEPRMLVQLEIEYADGTRQVVAGDDSWRTADGPTVSDSLYAGETYDAREAQPGWSRPGFDDAAWRPVTQLDAPKGTLTAQPLQPIRVVDSVDPVEVTEVKQGVHLFDFGRTIGGWAELRVTGRRGTRIALEYGQQLHKDGTVNLEQGYVHGGRFQRDEYVLSGEGDERWQPRFSHKSFRYVQVTGLPAAPSKELLRGLVVHTDAPLTGHFSCSSDLYNRIHAMVVRSTAHHMVGIPAVDVMYEKIGWTADGQLNTPVFALNFRSHAFLAKWLDDIADSQSADGSLPVIAPSGGWGYGGLSPEWTTAYPIVMWELHQRFGDRAALERHYEGACRYIAWCAAQADDDGLVTSGNGDWLPPGGSALPPEDVRLSATAYLLLGLRILIDSAEVLGKPRDAKRYAEQHAKTLGHFNSAFLDRERGIYRTDSDDGYRQTSNALALAFGLAPKEFRARIARTIADDVRERDGHLNTGCLGTAVLLPVLSEAGHEESAHAIAGQRTFPSWGFWLEGGADTLWETWETEHSGQGRPPSHDHYLFGSVDRWFYEHVAGITPAEPGYRRIRIRPYTRGPLTHASARLETAHGWVSVRWEKKRGRLELDVTVPPNTSADVHLPAGRQVTEGGRAAADAPGVRPRGDGVFRVGAGRYRFRA
ncbi:hydrolase [Streptomyces triticagri]|uniref:alpha-L-rhamnosidase n=1 Tax=Streptomyces triticagri TaxID=2293568 RepID=A0A372LYZ0_9ACTN|nr:family 78 glycoside hydrolase catalytic domain [Streptomyces triticagri]RFU83894.1 hydrolase [Streptomyces triticagri]